MRLRKSSVSILLSFFLLSVQVPARAFQGHVYQIDGDDYLCYDAQERIELIGALAACGEYKRRVEADDTAGAHAASTSWGKLWAWFATGAILGATSMYLIKR